MDVTSPECHTDRTLTIALAWLVLWLAVRLFAEPFSLET